MESAFRNMSLILKNNHFACIWFHELELPIWNIMINAAQKAGLYYIEQTHVLTSIRSLKPKFTPNPTLTGHVLAFFIKLQDSNVNTKLINGYKSEFDLKSTEQMILKIAKKIIEKNGKATTNELYTNKGIGEGGIISTLIKKGVLNLVAQHYKNLFKIFKKELYFNQIDGKWYLIKE